MTISALYIEFLICLIVGLVGLSAFLKAVIEHFLTDRGLKDYEWRGRLSWPSWGYTTYYGHRESSLLAVLTRLLVRIPPPRRVAELQVKLHGD